MNTSGFRVRRNCETVCSSRRSSCNVWVTKHTFNPQLKLNRESSVGLEQILFCFTLSDPGPARVKDSAVTEREPDEDQLVLKSL
jgi:hypothetical protein